MSVRSSVVCDNCGKDKPPAAVWLRLEAACNHAQIRQGQEWGVLPSARLAVSAPRMAASTGTSAIDLCSRECAGLYFFGPVST